MRALVIPAHLDEPVREEEIPDTSGPEQGTLLRKFVGGWLEALPLNTGDHLYLNEEGKLQNLHPNGRATALAMGLGGLPVDDYLCGNVVILGPGPDGEHGPISDTLRVLLRQNNLFPVPEDV